MKEPRPAMISARPLDSRSSVANCWNTRTGSSDESTVTALVSLILLGAFGGRGENHRRRRGGVVGAVMLAQAEHVEADLVGKLDLFDQVAQPLMRADVAGALFRADVGKSIETEFHSNPRRRAFSAQR